MQTATLIFSIAAFGVSCATLAIVLVGGTKIQQEVAEFKLAAERKRAELKQAFESLI